MHSLRGREGEAVEGHLLEGPMRGTDSQAKREAVGVAGDAPLYFHSDGGHARNFEAEVSENATIGCPGHEAEARWHCY